jgi:hypothetical protein
MAAASSFFVPAFLRMAAVHPQEVLTLVIFMGPFPMFRMMKSWVISGPSSTMPKSQLVFAQKILGALAMSTVGVGEGGTAVEIVVPGAWAKARAGMPTIAIKIARDFILFLHLFQLDFPGMNSRGSKYPNFSGVFFP